MRLIFLILSLLNLSGMAQAQCRQALSLGLDVSGSVDSLEYRMQVDGLAGALLHPDVQRAILSAPEAPIALHVFEWAGQDSRRVLQGWTLVRNLSDLTGIAGTLRTTTRRAADPATALGEAMMFGAAALETQYDCDRLTLDISGDGRSNAGPRPRQIRHDAGLDGITINGLVVASGSVEETDELEAYYRAEVIRGPEAFVERAAGFEDFEKAMVRKLLRELQTLMLSRND